MGTACATSRSRSRGGRTASSRLVALVAVAGGDGTVADVMRVLAGSSAPMTVLPFGTANNVAASLGLAGRPVEELVAGWETGRQLRYFTGRVTGGGATSTFVEALGGGLCAAGIERLRDSKTTETAWMSASGRCASLSTKFRRAVGDRR